MKPAGFDWRLPALLALALAVRVAALLAFPSINHPDEIFQLFEPAHRLAFGYGVKTWEFQDGIRSMVPPYVLAALFAVSEPVFGGPEGYLRFTGIVLAAISCLPVLFIWRMGERESRAHALVAGVAAATWFELVYFSFRPLTEALACDAILIALALASSLPPLDGEGGPTAGRHGWGGGSTPSDPASQGHLPHRGAGSGESRVLFGLGLALALTVMLRLQLAPGAAFVALWVGRARIRSRWAPMILGATPVLVLFGAVDWLTWGAPFASYVRAVSVNLGQNKASVYGASPWWWYLVFLFALWTPFVAPLLLFCIVRLRKSAVWIGFAVIEIAVHSLIGHKEYRFVFPAFAALVIPAALGATDLVERYGSRWATPAWRGAALAGCWAAMSLTLGDATKFRPVWEREHTAVTSEMWLAKQPGLCGVLFYDRMWLLTGGYAYLHRDVPIYDPVYHVLLDRHDQMVWPQNLEQRRAAARRAWPAYNYVLVDPASAHLFTPGYRVASCFATGAIDVQCLMVRPGPCRLDPSFPPLLSHTRLGEPQPIARAAEADAVP